MKNNKNRLFALLLLAWAPFLLSNNLPEPDPGKPLYQKQWGGTVIAWPIGDIDEVSWPRLQTIEEVTLELEIQKLKNDLRHETELKESGTRQIKLGVIGLIFGVIAMVVLSHWGLELFGLFAALIGFGFVLSGALTMKIADHITGIAVGAGFLVVIAIIYAFTRGRGVKVGETVVAAKTKINKIRSGLQAAKNGKG